jgi:hypothetical protein
MAGVSVVESVHAAATGGFVRDSTPPELSGFAVNMNASTLTLNFNEPVKALSLHVGSLVLRASND